MGRVALSIGAASCRCNRQSITGVVGIGTRLKVVSEVAAAPVTRSCKQVFHGDAIVFGTIGAQWTLFTFVRVSVVVLGSFAKAGGGVGVAGGGTRGTVVAAGGAIGFGCFAGFVQICINVTFFAGSLTAEILVLSNGACRTSTFRTAVCTQITSTACRCSFHRCCFT